MRLNRQIRAPKVRVIGPSGEQIGMMSLQDALQQAKESGLDLVEIAPNAVPPVCKIIDYGKFRYDQTKREKESKKAAHQIKVKEVKLKPNIGQHDLETKLRRAREFLEKGNKVKFTCMFRGREMAHRDIGEKLMRSVCESIEDVAVTEAPMKQFGRFLTVVVAPTAKKKKQ